MALGAPTEDGERTRGGSGEAPAAAARRPPDVLGWPLERARARLEAAGYTVDVLETRPPRGLPRAGSVAAGPWRVVAVRPARGPAEATLVVAREALGPRPDDPTTPPAGAPGAAAEGDGGHG